MLEKEPIIGAVGSGWLSRRILDETILGQRQGRAEKYDKKILPVTIQSSLPRHEPRHVRPAASSV